MIALKVNNSLGFGSIQFLHYYQRASEYFKSKVRSLLSNGDLDFNGLMLRHEGEWAIIAMQLNKILGLNHTNLQKSFTRIRALAQYIGVCPRPDFCTGVQLLAPGIGTTSDSEMKQI